MTMLSLSAGMALTFGALHALEPGHGKTAIISYVAAEKKGFKDGVVISVSSAITHSIAIFMIALISHFFFHHFSAQSNALYLNGILRIVSGVIICSIGLWYLVKSKSSKQSHSCCSCSSHKHNTKSNTRSSLLTSGMIGMAAGLIPCPTILIAYLAGVSSGNSFGGIENVFLFSVGMCFSMFCLVTLSSLFGEKMLTKLEGNNIKLNWRLIQGWLFIAVGLVTAVYH